MGSPLSAILVNLFMERFEQKVLMEINGKVLMEKGINASV